MHYFIAGVVVAVLVLGYLVYHYKISVRKI
jgi:hypothetical protein